MCYYHYIQSRFVRLAHVVRRTQDSSLNPVLRRTCYRSIVHCWLWTLRHLRHLHLWTWNILFSSVPRILRSSIIPFVIIIISTPKARQASNTRAAERKDYSLFEDSTHLYWLLPFLGLKVLVSDSTDEYPHKHDDHDSDDRSCAQARAGGVAIVGGGSVSRFGGRCHCEVLDSLSFWRKISGRG
jgi:hypothetical protein